MTPSRHFRGGDAVLLASGDLAIVRGVAVAPVELVLCEGPDGRRHDLRPDTLQWDRTTGRWVARRGA